MDKNIKAWEERKENYIKGLHGARGGLPAFNERLGRYIASLAIGREFGESVEHYFERKGFKEFVEWAHKELHQEEKRGMVKA